MLLATHRFPHSNQRDLKDVLDLAVRADIPIKNLIGNRALTDDDEAAEIIIALSRAAIKLNLRSVADELGEAHGVGSGDDDPDEVAEARPVIKEDKTVPFNLDTLRKHLSRVALAHRVLPTDLNARQKLLENSVYEAARERLAHQSALFDRLNLEGNTLSQPDLQLWMWRWHCRLKDRLKSEIKVIVTAEKKHVPGLKKKPVLTLYLALIKADKLSMLTIIELMRLQGTGGVTGGMKTARALIDTMISMLGGGHVCRRSIGSLFKPSPCVRVEKRKHIMFQDDDQGPNKARIVTKASIASTTSSKFGGERMIKATQGLLVRQSLEESCLIAAGEDMSALRVVPAFSRPSPNSRSRSSTITTSNSGADTPPLSSAEGSSMSDASQSSIDMFESSIDMSRVNVILSNATHPMSTTARDRVRARARGHGHRRRISVAQAQTATFELPLHVYTLALFNGFM
ncbi:hypothetical protein DFH09DRAFT_1030909 [Mycena vulgaris]|nr:hypothetical protein DFH09DRAFT_995691 [Mycena vulgaris]KAJ6576987.1 hypothetical protein DFH09DRAFT_1030909 [Mycena vulgaris]